MDFSVNIVEIFNVLSKDVDLDRRDAAYVRRRLKNEGVSFATKTLPKFAKAVLSALQTGQFCSRSELSDFAWKGRLPAFMRGYLLVIFNKRGELLEHPDPYGLWVIRQVCEYCYKLALPFTDEQLEEAEQQFVKTDDSLLTAHDISNTFLSKVRKNAESHYEYPTVQAVLESNRPRHGPGTYAGCRESSLPWYFSKADKLSRVRVPRKFRAISGFFKSYPASPQKVTFGNDSSDSSELLFVPKDSRGPRTIIREPEKLLMLQMAYFDFMVGFLERSTRKRVNFRDQQVNRDLARAGSLSGEWATIDLKEASDRVSYSVVSSIFRNVPMMRFFLSQRSRESTLPSGKTKRLNKLAGMGSGLTFATMSFVIHLVISTSLERFYGSYREASKNVYVYGDDIIVPTRYVSFAMSALESVGLKVNTSKSFTRVSLNKPGFSSNNLFRESCGGDYFCGNDVGPIRLKISAGVESNGEALHCSRDGGVLQIERHCRELVSAGFSKLADYYYSKIEQQLRVRLPRISGETPVLGRYSVQSTSYKPDSFGNYSRKKHLVPVPVQKVHPSPDEYHFIGKKLSARSTQVEWSDILFAKACRFDSYSVTIPRMIKLRKRKVSEFSLT